jgi:TRAP-type C4-dicarboxylate transport system permease large subunit
MKKLSTLLTVVILLCLSSCQVIGDIFKAGVWVGVLLVVGIIALIIYLVTRESKKN